VTGTRLALALLLGIGTAAPAPAGDGPGLFNRKPRMEPARVRQLTEIARTDADEKRRLAAVTELANADPRVHTDVIPALVAVVRKDASAAVRATAAEVIGRLPVVFPVAGAALETAAESDPSPAVREAAKQSLWEYHLLGYRSTRGSDGWARQTAEPPIARPAKPRPPVTAEPPPAAVVTVGVPPRPPVAPPVPVVGPPPGPRVALLAGFSDPRTVLSGSRYPNVTVEPPIARPAGPVAPAPAPFAEPPILPRWPEPVTIGKPPPIALDLPPIVTPPDAR
jgi:protein TonB